MAGVLAHARPVMHPNYISHSEIYQAKARPNSMWIITYRGRPLSKPMAREDAEVKIMRLQHLFLNLELMEVGNE